MKKLFSSLCVFAILCLLAFSGCSDGWTEVQSVTYYTDSVAHTYTSKIYHNVTIQDIEQSDYDNAPKEQQHYYYVHFTEPYKSELITMKSDRKASIDEVEKKVKTPAYCKCVTGIPTETGIGTYTYYKKYSIDTYEIRYVKIRFTEKNFIEVNYYNGAENETIKALFTSYEITYFKN
mgnify:CR=1 FL=1